MQDSTSSGGVRATSAFYHAVYTLVRTIPVGMVTSYGAIALALGAPRRARHVGNALAALHGNDHVPAHRVVNRSGALTGEHAFGPPGIMRALLEAEGVTFTEDGCVRMAHHFWEPPPTPVEAPR